MSAAIGAWIAFIAFWTLLIAGWYELRSARLLIFLALWIVGFVGRGYIHEPYGGLLFTSYQAALAVALVLIIYKRDITLL